MNKLIDLNQSVADLVSQYPELQEIMADLGFQDIMKPLALSTVGRVMTIPKGAAIKDIPLATVIAELEKRGFQIAKDGGAAAAADAADSGYAEATTDTKVADTDDSSETSAEASAPKTPEERQELLISYVRRLNAGETLTAVRKDFVKNFKDVDALEIAQAEQTLIGSGIPISDVQQLCDVHSALFRGTTREEKIAAAESEVSKSIAKIEAMRKAGAAATGTASAAGGPSLDGFRRFAKSGTAGTVADAGAAPDTANTDANGTAVNSAAANIGTVNAGTAKFGTPVLGGADSPFRTAGTPGAAMHAAGTPAAAGRNAREMAKSESLELAKTAGHPIETLTRENEGIQAQVNKIRETLTAKDEEATEKELKALRAISAHYSKKGDLLYPVLKSQYKVSGPSDVMWGVDDEIRDELRLLAGLGSLTTENAERLEKALTRAEEMIFKETNILFPICVQFFSKKDWYEIYREIPNYDYCLIDSYSNWPAGDEALKAADAGKAAASITTAAGQTTAYKTAAADKAADSTTTASGMPTDSTTAATGDSTVSATAADGSDTVIHLPSGQLTLAQLEAVLNTIPMELTFVDDQNINRYFNESSEKMFKRPLQALGREVFSCHPPKVGDAVRAIISDFRSGKQSKVSIRHTIVRSPCCGRFYTACVFSFFELAFLPPARLPAAPAIEIILDRPAKFQCRHDQGMVSQ